MSVVLKIGTALRFNNREWSIIDLSRGVYQLRSPGLPLQSIGYLKLHEWVESGRATVIA